MREISKTTKLLCFAKDRFFCLPALSAFMLGISRYPLRLNFLVFAAFIPLFYLLKKPETTALLLQDNGQINYKKVIKAALSFTFVYNLVTLYWISVVTIPGFIGTFILFGIYFTLLFYIIIKISLVIPAFSFWGFISSWLSLEWLQNFGEMRFPWFNIGYSLAEYPSLIQIAEFGGVFLISLVIMLVNVCLYYFIAHFPKKKSLGSLITVLLIFAIWISWGTHRLNTLPMTKEDFRAAIVQVSIPQYIKWDDDFYDSTLELYRDYTLKAAEENINLIIWPESAIPDYVLKVNRPRRFLLDLIQQTGTPIFLGLPHYEIVEDNDTYDFRFYNATTLIDKDGYIHPPYYKIYLVPVGERIPFMDIFPPLRKLEFGQANWEYGEEIVYYNIENNGQEFSFSSLICFEIAFPVLTNMIAKNEVDFMVNVTNDAWFKRTVGPYQHGMMTVIRAVETRTQIYRAANTGISMIVDPRGVITQRTKLFEKTTIDDALYRYPKQTFYVRYMTYYPIIFTIMTAILILIMIIKTFSLKSL